MSNSSFPSIHDDIPPIEEGGVIARDGFDFQDHIAAMFCLEMLDNARIKEVRCESQDDITLVWEADSGEDVEFAQVKGNNLPHLWSIAELCKREKVSGDNKTSRTGSSIIEKSLQNDRFAEKSKFRIVTRLGVNTDLAILELPMNAPKRCAPNNGIDELCVELERKVVDFRSAKGNDHRYWAMNTLWQVEHSTEAVGMKNKMHLRLIIERNWDTLTTGQVDKVYLAILQVVQQAALIRWGLDQDAKKIRRETFFAQLKQMVEEIRHGPITPIAKKMEEKMINARIAREFIVKAHDMREHYRRELLTPQYTEGRVYRGAEMEIYAILQELLSKLDAGTLSLSGAEFHNICLEKLGELRETFSSGQKPALAFIQGCMYYVTGRCAHRFLKDSYEINKEP